jgi:hypothetical protein
MKNSPELNIALTLFRELNRLDVRYCHWKSTYRLFEGMNGQTDLDILVDPNQYEIFIYLLRSLGFKRMLSKKSQKFPGLDDYLGFDQSTGRLIHLHVHYQLILGEQFVKNYHLPIEDIFFDNFVYHSNVKIPIPELELIILILRTLLKYRDRDIIKDLLKIGTSTGVPKDILDEFNFLLEKINIEQIILVRESYFQFISLELVDKFINLFRKSPRDGWRLYKFRTQIRRELKPFQRKSRRNIWFDYHRASFRKNRVVRYFVNLFNKSLKTKKKMNKLNLVFAFIGPDGSGKTTIVRSVREWLSWRLEVQSYYMGSSEPSIRTMILKRLFKIFRFWVVVWGHFFGSKSIFKRLFNIPSQLFNCLRFISEALDRYGRYSKGKSSSEGGVIVLYDRFPLEAFRQYQPIMDGSQISYRYQGKHWFLTRILSEIEERIYQGISPANHIFILHVSPNLSKIRKPDHKLDMIELKKLAIEQISDDRLNLIDIDSSIPLEDMLLQVKSKIWDFL